MNLIRRSFALILVLCLQVNPGSAQSTTWDCSTPSGGCIGHVRIQPDAGQLSPTGVAFVRLRTNNVLVSEAGFPAATMMQSGRVFAETSTTVDSGMVFVNSNSVDVVVTYYFTDAAGVNSASKTLTVRPNQQVGGFFNEAPFLGPSASVGTFTFSAPVPLYAVAVRSVLNERNEFLITTIPISPVSSLTTKAAAVLPHFIDAGNWYPHLVMVNPTNSTVSGRLEFFGIGSSSTNPVSVLIGGATGYTHNYSIPARSSRKISLTRSYDRLTVGTIRVTPTTGSSPHSFAILSYMTNGITLSSTVVPAVSTPTTSRIYTQTAGVWGNKGSLQSALTIANTGSTSANVQISVTDLNGASTGLSTSRYIAAGSHIVQYMNQLFPTMPNPFRGVVKVTAPVDVTVTGLRTMYNERGEFLISNVPGLNSPTTSSMEFPYVLTGQGYSTQLVLVNPLQTQSTGKLVSLSAAGDPVPPFFETP